MMWYKVTGVFFFVGLVWDGVWAAHMHALTHHSHHTSPHTMAGVSLNSQKKWWKQLDKTRKRTAEPTSYSFI